MSQLTDVRPAPERLVPACAQLAGMLADPAIATRTTMHTGKRERRRVR